MRRNRDRRLRRKNGLKILLQSHGLLPQTNTEALATLNPYALRADGLIRALGAHEFGRALLHLHQRRGFQSNRKADGGEDGKIATAVTTLTQKLRDQGHETYGAFLAARHATGLPTRLRILGEGAQAAYEFYPSRALIRAEFDLLFARQRAFGLVEANAQAEAAIARHFFHQRPLKSPRPGRCSLIPTEDRAPKSLPTAALFRVWSDVMNLRILDERQASRPLSVVEQDTAVAALTAKADMTFEALANALKLAEGERFNLHSARRKKLLGDPLGAKMRKLWKQAGQGSWDDLDRAAQNAVILELLDEGDDATVLAWLKVTHGLDAAGAELIAGANPSPARGHLSLAAMERLIDVMAGQRLPYDEAVKAANLGHHSDRRTGEVYDTLPYYGEVLADSVTPGLNPEAPRNAVEEFGRFPNPTVHIVLGRIQKLVNALIARDGKPAEIVVESGRELPLSAKARRELEREQRENTAKNDARAKIIESHGLRVTADRLLRLALHEELGADARCVFSGEKINQADALSDRVEVEHILPYSRTLDDSRANKTLSTRQANRDKGNRTPHEAFTGTPEHAPMLERVRELPRSKQWRFGANAMARFEEKDGWLARQLTDTQYMARLAVRYLTPVCARFDGRNAPCWATPGRLTAAVRHTLGLNEVLGKKGKKNRDDHRHHFVDAVVIGLMDRGFLQEIARLARRSADAGEQDAKIRDKIAQALGPLKEPLRAAVAGRAQSMVIAHRPDHSRGGALLEETAFGFIGAPRTTPDSKDKGNFNVSQRLAFPGDKFKKLEDLDRILSARTHARLHAFILPRLEGGEGFVEAASAAAKHLGLKKVRVGLNKAVEAIVVDGAATKAYASGGNWAYDLFDCPRDGFGGVLVNRRQANARDFIPPWKTTNPQARLITRLFGGDMIEIDDPRPGKEGRAVFRIQKMTAGKITLCDPVEANADARNRSEGGLFFDKGPKPLMELGLKKLHVSILGQVKGRATGTSAG